MERGGGGEVMGSAAVLEGTHLCSTRQLRDMLPCLGGVAVLLPFIAQVTLRLPSSRSPCSACTGAFPFVLMHTRSQTSSYIHISMTSTPTYAMKLHQCTAMLQSLITLYFLSYTRKYAHTPNMPVKSSA